MYGNKIILKVLLSIAALESVSGAGSVPVSGAGSVPVSGAGSVPVVNGVSAPCAACPLGGRCVPRVSCTGARAGAGGATHLECHLRGEIGLCCYPNHAAESKRKMRSYKSVDRNAEEKAHQASREQWRERVTHTQTVVEHSADTVVEPGSPDARHRQSLSYTDGPADQLGEGAFLNLLALQELKAQQVIDDDDVELEYSEDYNAPYCPTAPVCLQPPPPYRRSDGACNNPHHPAWGAANTGYERLLPPDYGDGIWSLRTSACRQHAAAPLASPRAVSLALLPDGHFPSETHNLLFMQFSQFIAHDLSSTVIHDIGNGSAISCCSRLGGALPAAQLHWACAPIAVDPADPFYSHFNRTCLSFVRAQLAPAPDCRAGYAKQMNGVTHFLDLSQLYGKSEDKQDKLRDGGYLKTFSDYGRQLPPLTERPECLYTKEQGACFDSGDHHGNQIISLTALHTVFTRQHNRVAAELSRLHPSCTADLIFHKSKLIVQAIYQHVVYHEWLPLLVGWKLVHMFNLEVSEGFASGYDPSVNPSVLAEFAAAAMRFGHSTVDGKIRSMCPATGVTSEEISLPELMFQPGRLRLLRYLDQLLAGLAAQPMQSVDPFLTVGLTRYLFRGGAPFGLDLAAINVQRGRDLGLRAYNHYRRLLGLQPFNDFNQMPQTARKRLSSVYACPEDIDLWIGGLLEQPAPGAVLGPTFAHILLEQFSRSRRGDRFYYEYGPDVNPAAFTPSELAEIKKMTMARIVCDNSDGIELTSMPRQAFLRADLDENKSVKCDEPAMPSLDLTQFYLKC